MPVLTSTMLITELDDIRVEYHPHSQLPSTTHRFSEFSRSCPTEDYVPRNNSPWEPFRTRLDFEIAEIALEAAMTKDQTNRLLDLVHRSASGNDSFTLQNHDEVRSLWELASQRYTKFQNDKVSVPHGQEVYEFEMHYRPLWDWALDLLQDRRLAPHFVFDAQRLSKFNGERFVRFIDEPWTADAFWSAQSQLPPNAKPLAFILYADKSKLSSFGSQKGYPIIARIANLPVHIRNGNTALGGGRVVGWLPIIVENQEHAKKKNYVDFKNAVWHTSFYQLLASVAKLSTTGYWFECGDGIQRHLWPLILILSADYEEQCVMALIRGLKGKFPCPVCLVPQDEQSVLRPHELRTSRQSKDTLHTARSRPSEKEKEDQLKAFSLRNVENVFWRILYTDVHRALSVDRLHTYEEGLWGDHLWNEVKFWISDLGRQAAVKLDTNFDALPRWPNLTHFSSVMAVDFNDGTVLGDLSKMIIFAAQDILHPSCCKLGHLLLRCIRYYVELDMYTSFEVQTEDTISAGRFALQKFSEVMEEYITESQPETFKNWNFPKKHLISHVFDDILAKGATRNYNTKPNEKMHGSLRKIYLQRTNFKNVASQILRYDEWLLTSTSMRTELDELDEYNQRDTRDPETNEALDDTGIPEPGTIHAHLGSKQGNHSFSDIMHSHGTDRAFADFRMKLNGFLNGFLPQNNIPLPDGRRIHLRAEDMITEFRFLRINYESMVDWRLHRDLLRCNPQFYGSPRYDCVMVKTADKPFFARLVYMFSCSIGGADFPLALIHPYDVGIASSRRRRDDDIGVWRVRAKPRSSSEIISVRSIVRGAALASDPETPGDYFVIHTVDTDIFLRVKALQAQLL
ncbi:hypothetical protein DEU56DRAFT_874099 [Suillus clintonianus]|uniref:uncharacterized protein n=1 Tax=Suillus clintonianus TaxID=1904413 RepID=UPI001B85F926|nr:uncharacterized protein DEU56DRAFT_874099 [Suillus clintonianus]KAG2117609.1 hypothetical protein DEU56DRAFT_874099 [Suillus clintonianus]